MFLYDTEFVWLILARRQKEQVPISTKLIQFTLHTVGSFHLRGLGGQNQDKLILG